MTRRIAAIVAGLSAVLVLAGCFPFLKSFTIAQDDIAGPVRIAIDFCDDDSADCGGPIGGPHQILVAYAIPEGAEVLSVKTSGTKELTLAASESYTQWLEANVPPADGLRWAGFISETVGSVAGLDPLWTVTAEIDPAGRTGSPAATFPYVARLAFRGTPVGGDDTPVDCTVNCPEIGIDFNGQPVDLDDTLAVRDIGLPTRGVTAIDRGRSSDVPITVRYAGATGSGELTPTVSTTIPGATATVPKVSFTSTEEREVPVTLDVPESTPPGDYELTVSLVTRKVTLPVHVDIPPRPVLDVAAIGFPETHVGKGNGPRNVLVTNSGTRALEVRTSEVSGPQAGEFRIVADECAGRTLRPGRDCIVALEFDPRAGGDRAASLRIPNAYSDMAVPLTGVGAVIPAHKDVYVTLGALRIKTASRRQLAEDAALVFEQDFLMTGDVSWRLRYRGVLVGEIRKRHIEAPGTRDVSLALTPAGVRALRRGKRHLVLTTALTDADGRRSVVRRMVRLKTG